VKPSSSNNQPLNSPSARKMHPLFYLHIPKAAGSTLLSIIERNYEFEEMLVNYNNDFRDPHKFLDDYGKSLSKNHKIKILCGHFGFGLHRSIDPQSRYLSMLRNPVSRVYSLYKHLRRNPRSIVKNLDQISIDQFLDQGLFIDADNGQVRRLCGIENVNYRIPFGGCSNEMLDLAKDNLKSYCTFGLCEYFDASILYFQNCFDWKTINYNIRNNAPKSDNSKSLSNSNVELIKQVNHLDIQLYDYAIELFKEKLNVLNIDIKSNLQDHSSSVLWSKKEEFRSKLNSSRRAINKRINILKSIIKN